MLSPTDKILGLKTEKKFSITEVSSKNTKLRAIFPFAFHKLNYRSKISNENCVLGVLKQMTMRNDMECGIMQDFLYSAVMNLNWRWHLCKLPFLHLNSKNKKKTIPEITMIITMISLYYLPKVS